jgi:hypothetical protein
MLNARSSRRGLEERVAALEKAIAETGKPRGGIPLEERVTALENPGRVPYGNVAVAVVGALGTGAGLLAVVTLAGAAATLGRFRGAGLPGTEAVAVVPQRVLLATGSNVLLPMMLISIVAILGLHLLRGSSLRLGLALGFLVLLGFGYFVWEAGGVATSVLGLFVAVGVIVVGACVTYRLRQRTLVASALVVIATIVPYRVITDYYANRAQPELRPAAVLFKDGSHVTGLWVAHDNTSVHIGRAETGNPASGRMMVFPRDAVAAHAVGRPGPVEAAERRAQELLRELRSQARRTPSDRKLERP